MFSVDVSHSNCYHVSSMMNLWFFHQETFQWNGITSKKKGQQWGKENRPFTSRNDYQTNKETNKEYPKILSNEKEKQLDEGIDFDKLPPLLGMPKVVPCFLHQS